MSDDLRPRLERVEVSLDRYRGADRRVRTRHRSKLVERCERSRDSVAAPHAVRRAPVRVMLPAMSGDRTGPGIDRARGLSAVAALVHGFTDRTGGVSEGRYRSLNLGRRWGDDPRAVDDNYARVAASAGFALDRLRTCRQVHGAAVTWDPTPDVQADAICCKRADRIVVGVLTADCVPVLIADRQGTVAAAVHSGWRGTVANVVGATVQSLYEIGGAPPQSLCAAIGPCIEQAAFEVGHEVADQFPDAFVDRSRARPHVDLVAAVVDQLRAAGVPAHAIERVGSCTHAAPERWYSYRRDGASIGQMLAFAGYVA